MVKNAQLLNTTRLRGLIIAYGHAMPWNLKWNGCTTGIRLLAPITSEFQGVSVPISGGGPPVLTE